MFSQASVILSTGGGGLPLGQGGVCLPLDPVGVVSASGSRGCTPPCIHNPLVIHPPDRHPPPGPRGPRVRHPMGRHPPYPPGQTPPRQTHPHPGRHTPSGRSPPPRDGHCSGRKVRILLESILVNSKIVSLHSIRSSTKKMIDY